MRIHLFIVDPQIDFVEPSGALAVPGADADMNRLAAFTSRVGDKLDDITVTLDSHQWVGIERPRWWKRASDGADPAPFTCLGIHPDGRRIVKCVPGSGPDANAFGMVPTEEEYTTRIPSYLHRGGPTGSGSFGYLTALAARGRYPHLVWPAHCCVGTRGWGVYEPLADTLGAWERDQIARVNYVVKGSNPWTEHFSAVQAEVVDPADPATQVNTQLVQTLESADLVVVAGEALSHCVANTVRDIAGTFSNPQYAEKLVLLADATSNVGGFEFLGKGFLADLTARGMRVETTQSFLA